MTAASLRPSNEAIVVSCRLLNGMDDEARAILTKHAYAAYAQRGELIWEVGSDAEFFGIVGEGLVGAFLVGADGSLAQIDELEPGDCFGSFRGAVPFLRTQFLASTDCWYLKVPPEQILRFLS